MKVQLLVSEWCASCHQAEKIWREVAEERDFGFEVVDMGQPEGKALANALHIRSIPALIVEGKLKGIGVQRREEALAMVAEAPPKQADVAQHVGLSMAVTSRMGVLSGAFYLFIAGGFLVFQGGLTGLGSPAPVHLLTIGFFVFMIYGLGEHMFPRFTGNPIRSGALAWGQLGLTHLGLIVLLAGLWLDRTSVAVVGAAAVWLGLALFALRLWPVLWPKGEN